MSTAAKDVFPEVRPYAFRCCVYRNAGRYVAECIDLDLMVKAKTAKIARRELRDAVAGYVQTALAGGATETIVRRRSPLSHRLRYHLLKFAPRLADAHQFVM